MTEPIDLVTRHRYRLWTTQQRYEFDERAAIMEYEGGLTRAEAEAAAVNDCTQNGKGA